MEQLSGTDSFMFYTERGNNYNHVGALGIYDPSTAPGGKVRFKDILRHFAARVDTHKAFRRRLASVPFGVDRPYWIEDADLDLEFHVRHIALPEPGDWRQLMIQVARIHSRPLDRSRPLWEIYVIERLDRVPGMPPGSFAIVQKYHHGSVDGQSAAALLKAIHALSPEPDAESDAQAAERAVAYAEREPQTVEVLTRAAAHAVKRATGLAMLIASTLARSASATGSELVARARDAGLVASLAERLPGFRRAPPTRFNRTVSANRVAEAVALPLDRIQQARRQVDGATLNDFFLAIVGGALRRYLLSKEELPTESLTALMPISLRSGDEVATATGNQVGGVPVRLATDVADPLARLRACHAAAQDAKRESETLGRGFAKALLDELPHAAAEAFVRYAVLPQINVTVSNVRGPDVPLYVAGARLVHFYPLSIAADYVGLNHTCFTYNGVMWIGVGACRNMLPDPAFYAQCLRESHDELLAAIDASTGRTARSAGPRSAKTGTTKRPTVRQRPGAADTRRTRTSAKGTPAPKGSRHG